ncbi:hypothetical protein [Streptomyces sp. KLMMK]|uniref:hypothetical protein n=1 Tax=Streptomyces sp. KLMMK TaxID=3109353 RepID=UPI002FFD9ACA
MLFLPFLWWLTVPLLVGYQLARTARRMARRVYPVHPEGHVEDPEVLRVQRVRAWVALAMSGVLVAVFGGWQDVAEAQEQFLLRLLFAPWLALLSAAVVVALLFWVARPGRGGPCGRGCGRSAGRPCATSVPGRWCRCCSQRRPRG